MRSAEIPVLRSRQRSSQPPVASNTLRRNARGFTSASPTYRLFSSTRQTRRSLPEGTLQDDHSAHPGCVRRPPRSPRPRRLEDHVESMNTTMSPVILQRPGCVARVQASGRTSDQPMPARSRRCHPWNCCPPRSLQRPEWSGVRHDSRHAASVRAELQAGTIRLTLMLAPAGEHPDQDAEDAECETHGDEDVRYRCADPC